MSDEQPANQPQDLEPQISESGIPVGTVVSSLLTFEQFRRAAGPGWVPADGRTVSTFSRYAQITGRTEVPDLRGLFLRGLNEFEPGRERIDEYRDPEQGRTVGSLQSHALGAHKHSFEGFNLGGEGTTKTFKWGDPGDAERSRPDMNTKETGSAETRPNNVAVYFYLKVHHGELPLEAR